MDQCLEAPSALEMIQRLLLTGCNLPYDCVWVLRTIWEGLGDQFIQDRPESIQVRRLRRFTIREDIWWLHSQLAHQFGGQVREVAPCEAATVREVTCPLSQTLIHEAQLDTTLQYDVLRGERLVHNALGMQIAHALHNLPCNIDLGVERKVVLLDVNVLKQRWTFLHAGDDGILWWLCTSTHEEGNVFMTDHAELPNLFPEFGYILLFGVSKCIDEDFTMPTSPVDICVPSLSQPFLELHILVWNTPFT